MLSKFVLFSNLLVLNQFCPIFVHFPSVRSVSYLYFISKPRWRLPSMKRPRLALMTFRFQPFLATYVWDPLTNERRVPAFPSHWRSEAIRANSEFENEAAGPHWSDLRLTLILRGEVEEGSEDIKKAAGDGEWGPGRKTTPSCRRLKLPTCPKRPTASNKSSFGPSSCGSRPVM